MHLDVDCKYVGFTSRVIQTVWVTSEQIYSPEVCSTRKQPNLIRSWTPCKKSILMSIKRSVGERYGPRLSRINGKIYYEDNKLPEGSRQRLSVPDDSRRYLLSLAQDNELYGGHLGTTKTARKLIRFWWPKLGKDVDRYVRSCVSGQSFTSPNGSLPGY